MMSPQFLEARQKSPLYLKDNNLTPLDIPLTGISLSLEGCLHMEITKWKQANDLFCNKMDINMRIHANGSILQCMFLIGVC